MKTRIELLDKSYEEQVRVLWEKTFKEDGPSFVDHYFHIYKEMEEVVGLLVDDNDGNVENNNDTDLTYESTPILGAMLHLNPYQVMWQGQLYDTNYIVGVATDKVYRRQGFMRKMIQWTLEDLYKKGEVFALLMPIDSRYYDQFGFGFVQDVEVYKFSYENTLRSDRTVPHQMVEEGNSIALLPIYNQYKRQFNLSHNRGMKALDMLIKEAASEGGKVVMVPDGYVIYYENETLFVRESCYTSAEGLLNILDYIGSESNGKVIEWQMPTNNPLKHLVPHMEGHNRTRKPFMMARILRVEELLKDMAEIIGDCIIKISDEQLFENNGLYRIRGGQVEKIGELDNYESLDITIDIESLAQWLFGYETLETLSFIRESVTLHRDVIYYPELPVLNYFNEFV